MTSLVESYYGLKKPPFSTSKSSGPVFMTEPLRGAAMYVRRGLETGKPIQCVSGPAGIGKSSLARALPKLCAGDYHLAVMSGRATCWEDMRRILLREFGIEQDRITRDGLEEARQSRGPLLIVIDDAQHLSPELLERVCILPQLRTPDGEPVTQVLLLADIDGVERERIRPLLAWLDRDAHHCMAVLEPGEVHGYLDTRLRRAGWQGHPLIAETGALALHRLTLGNPRRLSEASMQLLEYAATRGVDKIDGEFTVACFGNEKSEDGDEEVLTATPGAELCDDETLVLEEDWQEALANAPLTADSINSALSLELEKHGDEPRAAESHPQFADSPPIESIRSTYYKSSPAQPQYISRYREPKGQSTRTLVFLVCAAITAIAMYTSEGDLTSFFADFEMPFSFAAERMDEIDRMGESNAALHEGFSGEQAEEPDLSSVLYEDLSYVEPVASTEVTLAAKPR